MEAGRSAEVEKDTLGLRKKSEQAVDFDRAVSK